MTKTGQEIEDDVYEFFKNGSITSFIKGKVYKFGTRPRDSESEDAVVKFVTGLDGQIQYGTVVVNIYVKNIDIYDNGVFVRDIARCREIEIEANKWANSLTVDKSNYFFEKAQTIHTQEEADINQHFVSVRLNYKLSTF